MLALVTGGAGFIGSHLVEELLAQGRQVIVLDNLSTGVRENLERVSHNPNMTFLHRDVRDVEFLVGLLKHVELVYHLAGTGPQCSTNNLAEAVSINVEGTNSVLRAASRHSCKVVYVSSSEVYGKQDQQPIREDADCRLGPTSDPAWAFASMKSLAESACLLCAEQGLPVVVLRFFDVYGPRDRSGLTDRLLRPGPDEPSRALLSRSLLYVQDAVEALMLASHLDAPSGEIINIGWDRPASDTETQEANLWIPDIAKSRRLLGFTPRVHLEEGVARTVSANM